MSKSLPDMRATFHYWVAPGEGSIQSRARAIPAPGHVAAFTSAGLVGWTSAFTSPVAGERVLLQRGADYASLPGAGEWVMIGRA